MVAVGPNDGGEQVEQPNEAGLEITTARGYKAARAEMVEIENRVLSRAMNPRYRALEVACDRFREKLELSLYESFGRGSGHTFELFERPRCRHMVHISGPVLLDADLDTGDPFDALLELERTLTVLNQHWAATPKRA